MVRRAVSTISALINAIERGEVILRGSETSDLAEKWAAATASELKAAMDLLMKVEREMIDKRLLRSEPAQQRIGFDVIRTESQTEVRVVFKD